MKRFNFALNQERRVFLLVAGVFLLVVSLYFVTFKVNQKAQAAWWNDVWQYRKSISITSGSSAIEDFTVRLTVDTATLITNSKLRSDCGDLRFTSSQGVELPYWTEESGQYSCNDSDTYVWVKIDNVPATGGTTIYMYYGNPSATNKSNGDDTFVFFDDFNGSVIDNTKWTAGVIDATTGTNWAISSGSLTGGNNDRYLNSTRTFTGDFIITTRTYTTTAATNGFTAASFWGSTTDSAGILDHNASSYYRNDSSWVNFTYNANSQWTRRTMQVVGTTFNYWHTGETSGSASGTATNSGVSNEYLRLGSRGDSSIFDQNFVAQWDWIQVRKTLVTEPAATLNSEEQTTSPVLYYSFDEGKSTTLHNQLEKQGEEGLISWWKFDEGTGTTPLDTMARLPLTAVNVDSGDDWATGVIGSAFSPDGVSGSNDEYYECVDATCGSAIGLDYHGSGWTASAWVKFANVNTIQCAFSKSFYVLSNDNGGYNMCVSNYSATGRAVFGASNDNNVAAIGNTVLSNNTWYLLTGVYDPNAQNGNEVKLYINGNLDAEADSGGAGIQDTTEPFRIGMNGTTGTDRPLNGAVDEVKIYNRPLSRSEILAQYNSQHGHLINMDPANDWVDGARQNVNQKPLGKALDFDGTDDYIDIGPYNTTPPLSFSVWAKPTTLTTGNIYTIAHRRTSTSGDFDWYLRFRESGGSFKTELAYQATGGLISVFGTDPITTNQWYHLAFTLDGSRNLKLYLNNKVQNSETLSTYGSPVDTHDFTIGATDLANVFIGQIDEIKYYKTVIPPEQVRMEYNRGASLVLGAGIHAAQGAPPIGFWKLDEGSGYTAFDSSGKNHNAMLLNTAHTSWTNGKVGKAINFDGTNDQVYVADNSTLDIGTGSWSISAWIKTTSSTRQVIVNKGLGTGQYSYSLETGAGSDGKPDFYLYNTSDTTYMLANGTIAVNDNNWHHLSGTYDGTTIKLYIDGVLNVSSTTKTGTQVTNSTSPFQIGVRNVTGIPFNGIIDHVKVYNYARSAEQIHYDMATGSPIAHYSFDEGYGNTVHNSQEKNGEKGLVSWYKMNEASGTTVADETGLNSTTTTGTVSVVAGKFSNARSFPGGTTTDYVMQNPFSNFPTTAITTMYWVKTADSLDAHMGYEATGDTNAWLIYDSANLKLYRGSLVTTGVAINDNVWHHIAVTWSSSGGTVKLYVDGAQAYSGALSGTAFTSGGAFVMGQEQDSVGGTFDSAQAFSGYLENVKIFNRVLGAEEILDDYNSVQGQMINMDPATDWVEGARPNPQQRAMGKALNFDGTDDAVDMGEDDSLDIIDTVTIEAWVNPTTLTQASNPEIVAKGGSAYFYRMRFVSGGTVNFNTYGTSDNTLGSNTSLTAGIWNHVVMVYDGATKKIYINGKLDAEEATTGSMAYIAGYNLFVGGYSIPAENFSGSIDEVKIYNYPLTAGEVQTEYNRAAGLVLGAGKNESASAQESLLAWWKMDEGAGYYVADSSGKNNYGTFSNNDSTSNWAKGVVGNAANFNANHVIHTATATESNFDFERTDDFAISAWIYFDTTTFFYTIPNIISKYSGGIGWELGMVHDSEYLFFELYNGSANIDVRTATNSFRNDTWNHVVAMYDGSSSANGASIYINGVKQALTISSNDLGTSSILNNAPLTIGAITAASHWNGKMDNFKIFSRDLTDAEVLWEYNQGAPLYHWSLDQGAGVLAPGSTQKTVSTDGLVGFWTLDSAITVSDYSGQGNTLTNSGGPTAADGIKTGALDYASASSQYSYCTDANCGADLDYQGNGLTVSAWVIADSTIASGQRNILGKAYYTSSTDSGGFIMLETQPYNFYGVCFRNSSGTVNQACPAKTGALSTSRWTHIVGTYDNERAKLYVDGVLEADMAFTGGIKNVSNNFYIGGSTSEFWNGKVDHVKIWQRALDPAEVAIEFAYDEKYGQLTGMDAATDWIDGAKPLTNRPKMGKALDFDGTDDRLEIADTADLETSGQHTVTFWAKADFNNADQAPISKSAAGGAYDGWWVTFNSSGNIIGTVSNSAGTSFTTPTYPYLANTWYHVAMSWDTASGYVKLYVNGIYIGQSASALSGTFSGHTNPACIGCLITQINARTYMFNGIIDEVKFYNYALTASQVKNDYNGGSAVRF